MDDLAVYLPADRLAALARAEALPEHAHGAAMFADITGFTPLAEALAQDLGARHGAEELTALLNRVYSALIAQAERFGGSVVGFSGDAITCWFDDELQIADGKLQLSESPHLQSGVLRALAAGLAMRLAMSEFAGLRTPSGATLTLMVKVAVAAGPIRRFLIGDPQIQVLEVLAGGTLDRLSSAASLARRDDLVVDPATLARIEHALQVTEWRADAATQQRAAVIAELPVAVADAPWPALPSGRLPDDQLRPWVLPAIYARVRQSADPFLAELRPAVALMLQFGGLDHDRDDAAGAKLDAYIRQVQAILARYEGHLIDITMADKGGYLFAAFGALRAHEDDARRAALAALELRELRVIPGGEAPRLGISRGTMRTGPYGGATRRTYGVLGDEVNLACRLMSAAEPGQILASARLRQALNGTIQSAELPAIHVKGKRAPVAVYQLLAEAPRLPAMRQQGAPMPLIGRDDEYAVLAGALADLLAGASGVVIVDGEAGIGKSRLIGELAGLFRERGVAALSGAGQSIEQTSYSAWRPILQAYFSPGRPLSLAERQAQLHARLAELVPELADRLPLLNDILGLGLGDTHFTRSLDAAERGECLAALLAELLRAGAAERPLAIVLDDAHLLDARSLGLATRTAELCMSAVWPPHAAPKLLFVLALRSLDAHHPAMPQLARLLGLLGARRISLGALPDDQIVALAAARLGVARADMPVEVAELVGARAGGNPLFAEELIATLRDQGVIQIAAAPEDGADRLRCVVAGDLRQLDLPDTLQGLILGRIDRLPPAERLTLRVASVIGPTFEYRALLHIRNQQAPIDEPTLKNQLRALAAQDFTWLEAPEPRLAYRFKHVLTQEAAYHSLLYAQRRAIHRSIAGWYEQTFGSAEFSMLSFASELPTPQLSKLNIQNSQLAPYISLLAHHYRQAEDAAREWLYAGLVGEQAIQASAFGEAIACFERALSLTPPDRAAQRCWLATQLGRAHMLSGEIAEAERHYRESIIVAAWAGDRAGEARACFELGALAYRRKAYAAALVPIERSLALYRATGDQAGERRALDQLGGIYIELGEEAQALECYQQALALGRNGRARQRG